MPIEPNIAGFYRLTVWEPWPYPFSSWVKHMEDRGRKTRLIKRGDVGALFVEGIESNWEYDDFLKAGWNVKDIVHKGAEDPRRGVSLGPGLSPRGNGGETSPGRHGISLAARVASAATMNDSCSETSTLVRKCLRLVPGGVVISARYFTKITPRVFTVP